MQEAGKDELIRNWGLFDKKEIKQLSPCLTRVAEWTLTSEEIIRL
jgi:hypothetical protein